MIFIYTREIISKVNNYAHDAFFHYLVTRHDEIRRILCQRMIHERTIISTSVENSIIYGANEQEKKFVLDIVAKDDQGEIYNIEMQCYDIDESEMKRFQIYGFRLAQGESIKGKNYKEIKSVRQMIINNHHSIKGLNHYIHRFRFYDEEHDISMPYNLNEITIVQLAYLNMEITHISVFDELMYLFKYNRPYDKIEVDKNIREAIDMHDEYMSSNEWILAVQRERDRMARQTRENAHRERMEEMDKKMSIMSQEMEMMQKKTDELVIEFEEIQKEKSELNNELKEMQNEKSELNNELKEMQNEKSELNNELEEMQNEKNELNNELEEMQNEKSELNNELEEIQNENKVLTNEIEAKLKELEKINAEIEDKRRQL